MSEVIYDEDLKLIEEAEKEVRLALKAIQEQEHWEEQRKRVEQYYDEEIKKLSESYDVWDHLIPLEKYREKLEQAKLERSRREIEKKGKHKSKEQRFWNNYQDKKDRINELLKRKDRR